MIEWKPVSCYRMPKTRICGQGEPECWEDYTASRATVKTVVDDSRDLLKIASTFNDRPFAGEPVATVRINSIEARRTTDGKLSATFTLERNLSPYVVDGCGQILMGVDKTPYLLYPLADFSFLETAETANGAA